MTSVAKIINQIINTPISIFLFIKIAFTIKMLCIED
jgi:hypothetical protein